MTVVVRLGEYAGTPNDRHEKDSHMRQFPQAIGLGLSCHQDRTPSAPRFHGWSFTRSTTTPISASLLGIIDAFEHVGVSHVVMTKDYSLRLTGFSQFGA